MGGRKGTLNNSETRKTKDFSSLERSEGDGKEPERSGKDEKLRDPEVLEKAQRRTFNRDYILRILIETDECKEFGEVGQILRREGLYHSQLSAWRQKRESGELDSSYIKNVNRLKREKSDQFNKIAKLERRNKHLEKELKEAELIIDFQKKISKILGISTRKRKRRKKKK